MVVDNVKIITNDALEETEIQAYIDYIRKNNPSRIIKELAIKTDGDFVDLNYILKPVKFERIRRITGYLVGTTERWNNAKQAEERDRVKHA
jgi:hypothetical protein